MLEGFTPTLTRQLVIQVQYSVLQCLLYWSLQTPVEGWEVEMPSPWLDTAGPLQLTFSSSLPLPTAASVLCSWGDGTVPTAVISNQRVS